MALGDMSKGTIPADTVTQAETDAETILNEAYAGCFDPGDTAYFAILRRFYAAHLLYIWGFSTQLISSSVGDVSMTRGTVNMGDKTGNSPYFMTFKQLLRCPEDSGEFLTSI